MKKCKARGRTSKRPCGNPPMIGREVCRMHGGSTPRGQDSPNYKHGLYSQYAREALAEKIRALREQEDLLCDLREVLAVQGALLAEALERQELAVAIPITEALSRSIERFRKQPGSDATTKPVMSPEEMRDRVKRLVERQRTLLGAVGLEVVAAENGAENPLHAGGRRNP